MGLRVRKKKNQSGSISVQIVDRTNRGYKVVETLGYSDNEIEIDKLHQKAISRINDLSQNLFSKSLDETSEKLEILDFIDSEIESFVTFKATLFQNKKDISFIEKSRFLKESNIWLYVDGEFLNS